jgi:prepilin-type N-terminal cleavage/methylation domain-containing protein
VNPQSAIRNPQLPRRGYTLVELLIVMVILVILVATALPLVRRVMDSDRVREGSRQLSAYVSMAKTRAMQTGRPAGLVFVLQTPLGASASPTNAGPYSPSNPPQYVRQCTQLFLAEVPPTYAGSTQGARARIRESLDFPTGSNIYQFYPIFFNSAAMMPGYEPDPVEALYLYTLIKEGEPFLVRFEHKGPWFKCLRGIATNADFPNPDSFYYLGRTTLDTGPIILPGTPGFVGYSSKPLPPGIIPPGGIEPVPSTNPGYYYQIMRSPAPVGDPLELTGGVCIDMAYSGAGVAGYGFSSADSSLAVLFNPSGGVASVYTDQAADWPAGTLNFLVGRVTKMNNLTGDVDGDGRANLFDPDDSNLSDATSLWVSIGRANGATATSENTPNTAWTDFTATGAINYLITCRRVATGREQMGGQ